MASGRGARTMIQLSFLVPTPPTLEVVVAKKPGRKQRRAKRGPTEAQAWAQAVFRTDYGELPPGRHQAIGCGCLVVVEGKRSRMDLCQSHLEGANGAPQFDLPMEWVKQAVWAERERRWYYSLPQAELPKDLADRLSKLATPWDQLDRRNVGKPERYPGIFTIDDGCGCRFKAVKIVMEGIGKGRETRIRRAAYWYAVRVGGCGQEGWGCDYSQYPLSPDLKKIVRQNRKR